MKKISLTLLSIAVLASVDSYAMNWFFKKNNNKIVASSPELNVQEPVFLNSGTSESGRPYDHYEIVINGETRQFIRYTDERGGREWLKGNFDAAQSNGSVLVNNAAPAANNDQSENNNENDGEGNGNISGDDNNGDVENPVNPAENNNGNDGEGNGNISGDDNGDVENPVNPADNNNENAGEGNGNISGDDNGDVENPVNPAENNNENAGEGNGNISGDDNGDVENPAGVENANNNGVNNKNENSEGSDSESDDNGSDADNNDNKDQEGLVATACSFVSKHKAVIITVGASTGVAITTAYLTELYNKKYGKKINKMQMAAAAWVATAIVFGGYFYYTAPAEVVNA